MRHETISNMTLEERKLRISSRGESSNHCHVFVGDDIQVSVNAAGELEYYVPIGSTGVKRHLLETEWLEGREVWTKEHEDIILEPGYTYGAIQQVQYDPYDDIVRPVFD